MYGADAADLRRYAPVRRILNFSIRILSDSAFRRWGRMKKIPIVQTIKAAYGFVFTHLGAIIGLIWVPMVLVTVLGFFVEQRYYAAAADALASDNYARLGPSVISLFCYFVAAILLYAMMYVPVMQLALGQRKDGAIFHFALGPAEWRMFRALASLAAFLFLPGLITAFLFNSVAGLREQPGQVGAGRGRAGIVAGAVLSGAGLYRAALLFFASRSGGE